jgi:threonine dehydratase
VNGDLNRGGEARITGDCHGSTPNRRIRNVDRHGALKQSCTILGDRSMTEFNYRFDDPKNAHIFVGVQVPPQDKQKFQKFLDSLGYEYAEETGNPGYKLFLS